MDWQHALDIQMDTHKWKQTETGMDYLSHFYAKFDKTLMNTDQIANIANHCMNYLYRADTMFITKDMLNVILQAAHDLPDEVKWDEHMILSRAGFCVFEDAIIGEDVHGHTVTVNAIGWEMNPTLDDDMCIMLYFYSDTNDYRDDMNESWTSLYRENGMPVPPMVLVHWYPAFPGDLIPHMNMEIPASELVIAMLRVFFSMQYLAHQSIGAPQRMTPPRHSRKRARNWGTSDEKYITLITLRRKSVKKENEDDEPPIERSHRWIVRGHWRWQYYSKTKTHAWKYIYEHIKGPEDKPLIISERRVFNFRR